MSETCVVQIDAKQPAVPENPRGVKNPEFIRMNNYFYELSIKIEANWDAVSINNLASWLLYNIVVFRLTITWDPSTKQIMKMHMKERAHHLLRVFPMKKYIAKANKCIILSGIQFLRDDFPEFTETLVYHPKACKLYAKLANSWTDYVTRKMYSRSAWKELNHCFKKQCYPPPHHYWWDATIYNFETAKKLTKDKVIFGYTVTWEWYINIRSTCIACACILSLFIVIGLIVKTIIFIF